MFFFFSKLYCDLRNSTYGVEEMSSVVQSIVCSSVEHKFYSQYPYSTHTHTHTQMCVCVKEREEGSNSSRLTYEILQ